MALDIERLRAWILAECRTEFGQDLANDPIAIQRINAAVQKAAREGHPGYEIKLPFLFVDHRGPRNFARKLGPELFS
jgi:molecular chaperone DnaK